MSLPLSSSSETTSLQLKKDMYMKMKETTATKTDILVNTCNHSPVEERLKLPDGTNQGMANGSVDNGLCCDSVNGVELCNSENDNLNESRQDPFSHSLITNCDSEIKSTETATSCTVSDCGSNVSQVSLVSDSDIVIESSGDADLSGKSSVLNNDNNNSDNIERLIDSLGNTSLRDCIADENDTVDGITYVVYKSEKQMPDIMRLITKDLSEPYSIYTYRYFIHNWPKLCFLAMDGDVCIGAIVCKLDLHKKMVRRGYIAMLAVDSAYRRRKLGSTLVTKAIKAMIRDDCDEVVLETEITNQAALRLYENLGFVRDKRLFRYYLNGVDALRLKLWLR